MKQPAADLEGRVEALARELERLAARVERLESAAPSTWASDAARDASEAAAPTAPVVRGASPADAAEGQNVIALVGRTCMTLGGAFLLRALSEGAYLAPALGALAGLVYAAIWLWAAHREARAGRRLSATFHALATLAIGYPLIVEASLRFDAFSPSGAALAALGVFSGTLVVAVRHRLRTIAGLSTAAAGLTELVLLVGARDLAGPGLALLALALAVEALTRHGLWPGLRWLAAASVDLGMLLVAFLLTRPAGLPEGWAPLPAGLGLTLLLGLPLLYLVSTAARTLRRSRLSSPFEIVQAVAASLLGFGGAWLVLERQGQDTGLLGALLILLAVGRYGVAFAFLERRAELTRNFYTYSSFAIVTALAGSAMILSGSSLALLLAALGLAALWLGIHYERSSLRLHASLYLLTATLPVGLLPAALSGLGGAADRLPDPAGFAVVLAAAVGYALAASRRGLPTPAAQIARTLLAVLLGATVPGLLVGILSRWLPGAGTNAGEAALDALRMCVLAGLALGLAWAGRRWRLRELTWCVYPVLVGAGLHLLTHDLRHGRALTLFVSLGAFGAALLLTPRLMRTEEEGGPQS